MGELLDEDGLDVIEALVADATAVEGVAAVHEGSGYFAERVIRRAVQQGNLRVTGPSSHPAIESAPTSELKAEVTPEMIDAGNAVFYVKPFQSWAEGMSASYLAMRASDPEVQRMREALTAARELALYAQGFDNPDRRWFAEIHEMLCAALTPIPEEKSK